YQEDIGVYDSPEQAERYIMSLSRGLLDESLVRQYIHSGPEMVRFLDEYGNTEFTPVADFPDYHPEHPGGLSGGGRTIECPPYSFEELGEWANLVTESPYLNPYLTMSETSLGAVQPIVPNEHEMERRANSNTRGAGQALAGRLIQACLSAGVQIDINSRARRLITEGDRIVGVQGTGAEGTFDARASQGV